MKKMEKLVEGLESTTPFWTVFKATIGYYVAQLVVTSVVGIILALVFYSIVN